MKAIKINLGSGPSGINGWINYDWGWLPVLSQHVGMIKFLIKLKILNHSYLLKWPKIHLHDLRKGIPLRDQSVDWIYCSNFLEHLEKYQTEFLLRECYRVLKKNGRIRIILPDLKKMVKKYQKLNDAEKFCKDFYGFEKTIQYSRLKSIIYKAAIRGHQWMYDEKSLRNILKNSGFKKIVLSGYQKSEMPEVKSLDLPVHRELGIYTEASKN